MRSATVLAGLLAGAGAHVLRRTDQCYALDGPSCTNHYIGQKDTGKQVCTRVSGSNLVVDYPAVNGYPYSEVHVYLGSSPPSKHTPGQFPYTSNNGYCKVASDKSTATCTIPMGDFASCDGKYYIATHSAQGVETGWGQGPCISKSCKPWAMYWGPITVKCPPCPTTKQSATTTATTPTTTKYSTTPTTTKDSTTKDTTTKDKDTTTKMDTTTKDKDTTTKMDTTTKDKDTTTKDTTTTPTTTKKDTTTSDTMTTPTTTTKKDTTTKDKDTTTKMETTTKDKDNTTKMDTTTKKDTTTKDKDTTTKDKDTTTKMCESTTTPAPITTTSDCPKETSSKSQTTYYETSYTTTVKTDVYTKTSDVYDYYTITSMCEATQTQAPIKYTTTCAAY